MGTLHIIEGDFLDYCAYSDIDVAIQNCNCFNVMGAGIAKSIAEKYPEVQEADLKTKRGDPKKLGTFSSTKIVRTNTSSIIFANIYGQYKYSYTERVFSVPKFSEGLQKVIDTYRPARLLLPLVGSGLAGGDPDEILAELKRVASVNTCDFYLVKHNRKVRKIVVAGSRKFKPTNTSPICAVWRTLDLELEKGPLCVISGLAKGPDMYGKKWCARKGLLSLDFKANWTTRAGGHIRNAEMGSVGTEAIVFWDGSSPGSNNMIQYMKRHNKEVTIKRQTDEY